MRVDVDQRRLASGIGKQVELVPFLSLSVCLCKRAGPYSYGDKLPTTEVLLLLRRVNDIFASLSLSFSVSLTHIHLHTHTHTRWTRSIDPDRSWLFFVASALSSSLRDLSSPSLSLSLSCGESHSALPVPNKKKKKEVEERVLWLDSLG